jgi:ribosomal protein S12 methylthiotransferase
MRGRLVSRTIDDVLAESEKLVAAGVRELLIVSQDTSAYGADLRYRSVEYKGANLETRLTDLARELGQLGVWVRLHYVYPYPNVDDLVPLMADGKVLPYLDVPLQHAEPRILKAMRRPANSENTLERIGVGARSVRKLPFAAASSLASRVKPRPISPRCSSFSNRRNWTGWAASSTPR